MLSPWLFFGFLSSTMASENGLGLTPPMGWLSWLAVGCNTDCDTNPEECLSEELIKRTADRMASDGYLEVGYEYVIIDDCWLEFNRSTDGTLVANKKRFPSGIKALAEYVHSKGLKFGIYEDIGSKTCAGYPGLEDHMKIDAKTLVSWDIDYIKVDGCNPHLHFGASYPAFGKLLNRTGRPVLYSCSWPAYETYPNYTAIAANCNIWRNYVDIETDWETITDIMDWFASNQDQLVPLAGPGHFNDPDMLVIGNIGITVEQARVQMAIWAILAAPLLMSTDLDVIMPEFREILLDKDVIDINQCKLGKQGARIYTKKGLEIWSREVCNGRALAFVNRNDTIQKAAFTFNDMKLPNAIYVAVELFEQEKPRIMNPNAEFHVTIPPTGVNFYKVVIFEEELNEIDSSAELQFSDDYIYSNK